MTKHFFVHNETCIYVMIFHIIEVILIGLTVVQEELTPNRCCLHFSLSSVNTIYNVMKVAEI